MHPLLDSKAQYIFAHPAIADTMRKALKLAGVSEKRGDLPRIWLLDDGDSMASVLTGQEKDVRTLLDDQELNPIQVRNPKDRTALVCYSSGTRYVKCFIHECCSPVTFSGKPKGVELTQ